jgi:hypothetical protein
MVTSKQALKKYGDPNNQKNMILWDVPSHLEVGVIPKRIYCNRDLVDPLSKALNNLIITGHVKELKTWDGCFNIRRKRGLTSMSLHSWGLAIDVNAFENGLNQIPKLSPGFVKCFTDAGFYWGGNFKRRDGMHFEIASI